MTTRVGRHVFTVGMPTASPRSWLVAGAVVAQSMDGLTRLLMPDAMELNPLSVALGGWGSVAVKLVLIGYLAWAGLVAGRGSGAVGRAPWFGLAGGVVGGAGAGKRLAVVLGLLWALVWSAPVLGLTYGGNLLTGGSCLASSEYNATYACGKAVDGSTGTRWASSDFAIPAWGRYDFGPCGAGRVDRLGINLDSTEHADGLVLAGSQDGSAWTTLLTTNGANATGWQYFEFTNGTAYRLYRGTVNKVHAGGGASLPA